MPSQLPRPTDVELQIMEVFWTHGSSTVREAHTRITASPQRKDTSYATTLKMIQILHEKGYLRRDATVRPQVYRTTVTREETQRRVVEDVTERLFGGAMTQLVQCAISSDAVSADQLDVIQRLIRQAKKQSKKETANDAS